MNYINIEIATILKAAVINSAILLLPVVQDHTSTISVERLWAFFQRNTTMKDATIY